MRCKESLNHIAENTTIHGLKDLCDARSFFAKIFWTFVIMSMCSLMVLQIWQIFADYLEPKTGSQLEHYIPEQLPKISVCPKYWANLSLYKTLDRDIISKLSDTDIADLDTFMTGHLWYGRILFAGGNSSLEAKFRKYDKLAKKLLQKYGQSLETFALKHAFEPTEIVKNFRFYPSGPKYGLSRYVSHAGVCYSVEPKDFKLNIVFMDTAFQILELNSPEKDINPQSAQGEYYVLFGGREHNGATGRVTRPLRSGVGYSFGLKVHRSITFNKDWAPCVNDRTTFADFQACVIRFVNSGCGKCKYFASSTPNNREEIYKAPLCNYGVENMNCGQRIPFEIGKCKPPCDNEFGELMPLGETESTHNNSVVFFTMENYRLNIKFTEYPIYSNSGFYSALGGTISLYFGASIVSMIQIIYLATFWRQDRNLKRSETAVTDIAVKPVDHAK